MKKMLSQLENSSEAAVTILARSLQKSWDMIFMMRRLSRCQQEPPEFVKKNEEIMINSLLYDLVNQMYLNTDRQDESPKDKIFEAECQVVRNLAKKGNCVIVGRCADYVLRNSGNFDFSLNTDLGEEYIENCIRSAMKL